MLTSIFSKKHNTANELQILTRQRCIELIHDGDLGGGGSLGKNVLAVSITGNHKRQEISSMSIID